MQTNMNPYRQTMQKVCGTILLLICAACSKTPSSSEINVAATGLLSNRCKPASIENVRLINGTAIDEQHYRAKVGFDVVIAADPRVKEFWSAMQAMQAQVKAQDEKFEQQSKEIDDTLGQAVLAQEARLNEMYRQPRLEGESPEAHEEVLRQARDELSALSSQKDAKRAALNAEHGNVLRSIKEQFKGEDEIKSILSSSGCFALDFTGTERDLLWQTLSAGGSSPYEPRTTPYKVFGEGVRQGFASELLLIKTDNGWKTGL